MVSKRLQVHLEKMHREAASVVPTHRFRRDCLPASWSKPQRHSHPFIMIQSSKGFVLLWQEVSTIFDKKKHTSSGCCGAMIKNQLDICFIRHVHLFQYAKIAIVHEYMHRYYIPICLHQPIYLVYVNTATEVQILWKPLNKSTVISLKYHSTNKEKIK